MDLSCYTIVILSHAEQLFPLLFPRRREGKIHQGYHGIDSVQYKYYYYNMNTEQYNINTEQDDTMKILRCNEMTHLGYYRIQYNTNTSVNTGQGVIIMMRIYKLTHIYI